jgi:hypothetical protein
VSHTAKSTDVSGFLGYNTDMRRQVDPNRIEVVDDAVAEILRKNGPAASIEIIASSWRLMREMLFAQIHSNHPDWTPSAIHAEVNRRLIRGST